jgi:hypothetical protein
MYFNLNTGSIGTEPWTPSSLSDALGVALVLFIVSSDTARLLKSLYPLAHPVTSAVLGDTKNGTSSDLASGRIFGLELQNERSVVLGGS